MVIKVKGNRLNIFTGSIEAITLSIKDGRIVQIEQDTTWHDTFLIPGLVDAHIHLESSMLLPESFANEARKHGTLAVVADPHEIANVAGEQGLNEVLDLCLNAPLYFALMAPSCVPASPWDTSCATLDSKQVKKLLERPQIHGLGEVMNVPGVLQQDPELMSKIQSARFLSRPIDGHCPGLSGVDLDRYIQAGIQTDHECVNAKEALEKINKGMKILVREGSAAKNLDALLTVLDQAPESCMLCTDDLHPDDLVRGHLLPLLRRAIHAGLDPIKLLRCASLHPIVHYHIPLGLLQEGDSADFLMVDSLKDLTILQSWYKGKEIIAHDLLPNSVNHVTFSFKASKVAADDFLVLPSCHPQHLIGVKDSQLITENLSHLFPCAEKEMLPDLEQDIIRIALINRYQATKPVCSWVKGLGLKQGAFASSVAHDSHHILVAGINKTDMAKAVNEIILNKGGLCASYQEQTYILPLPLAGLMSALNAQEAASAYSQLDQLIKSWGSKLSAPLMTLSFLGLLVIPALKIGEHGLFDSLKFEWLQ